MNYKSLLLILLALILGACQPHISTPVSRNTPFIRVLLSEVGARDSVAFKGSYLLRAAEADYELGSNNSYLIINSIPNGFRLSNPNRIFTFRDGDHIRLTAKSPAAIFHFNGHTYTGDVIITKSGVSNLQLINRVDLEEYLKGVVPSEMPSGKEGYREALKAQAICARTYALKKMLSKKKETFDVYADVWDQVYKGKDAEKPLASEAIMSTYGDVLMYKDTLATIYYHSTCGGLTESVQNVWPSVSYPYLQSQKDIIGSEFACSVSPLFRWQRSFSMSELDSLFNLSYQKSFLKREVADTTQLQFKARVLERTRQGRVQKMEISYGDTNVVLNGYTIRRFFSKQNQGHLRSRFFDLTANDSSIVIKGGGYGHGVGMCQWGALNMSEKGFKYYDILVNKYFKGTYLKKVY